MGRSPTRSVQHWFCSSAHAGSPRCCPGPRRSNTGGRCLWGNEGWGDGLPLSSVLGDRNLVSSSPAWSGGHHLVHKSHRLGALHTGAPCPTSRRPCHDATLLRGRGTRQGRAGWIGPFPNGLHHRARCLSVASSLPRSDERWLHPWPGQLCPWGEAPAPGDSSPRAGQVEAEVHTAKRQQAASSPPARRLHRRLEPLSCLPPPSRLLPLGPSCLPHRPTPRALLPQLCPGPTQASPGCKAKLAASRGRLRAFMVVGSGEQSLGGFKGSAGRGGSCPRSTLMVWAPGRGRSSVPDRLHPPWPSLCFQKAEPAGDGAHFSATPGGGPQAASPPSQRGRFHKEPRKASTG